MLLTTIVLTLILVGILIWLVNTFIDMDGIIKKILNIAVMLVMALWLLNVFSALGCLDDVHVTMRTQSLEVPAGSLISQR
ncbi:MAG: hypothetical protein NT154_11430 [Verrucomicrobia bacterium]|nr:hypothetical protein [Verrucomicrobiota bacterium]